MWNTRPKTALGGTTVPPMTTQSPQQSAPPRTQTMWMQVPQNSRDANDHRPSELDESLDYLNQYVNRNNSTVVSSSSREQNYQKNTTTPNASKLAQPKVNPALQQWMAAREANPAPIPQREVNPNIQAPPPLGGPARERSQHSVQSSYASQSPQQFPTTADPRAQQFMPQQLQHPNQTTYQEQMAAPAQQQQWQAQPQQQWPAPTPAGPLSEPTRSSSQTRPMNIFAQSTTQPTQRTGSQQAFTGSQQAFTGSQQAFTGSQQAEASVAHDESPPPPVTAPPVHAFTSQQQQQQYKQSTNNQQPQQRTAEPHRAFSDTDHDGNLVLLTTYLKNHYGREMDESSKGLESMEPEDILGLAQCYYVDVYRLLKSIRERSTGGKQSFLNPVPDANELQPVADEKWPPFQPQQPQQQVAPQQQIQHRSSSQNSQLAPQPTISIPAEQIPRPHASLEQQPNPPPPPPPQAIPSFQSYRSDFQPPSHSESSMTNGIRSTSSAQHYDPFGHTPKSVHKRELSLEQQLRDIPRRTFVAAIPSRVGMPTLRAGAMLLKYCRSGPPHLRYFSVQDKKAFFEGNDVLLPHFTWSSSINGSPSGSLSMLTLEDVLIGPVGPNASRFMKNVYGAVVDDKKKPVDENLCFTLVFADRTLELCAQSDDDYLTWVGTLKSCVEKNKELRLRRQ